MKGRLRRVAIVAVALECATSCDAFRDDVYRITVRYEDGDDVRRLMEAAYIRGAEECDADDRLTTVRFEVENVPEDSDIGLPLKPSESCADLIDLRDEIYARD